MFVWESEAFRNYGSGHIISLGVTILEARIRVAIVFEKWLKERRDYWFNLDGSLAEMFKEDYERLNRTLLADLAKEPKIETVLIIEGSN